MAFWFQQLLNAIQLGSIYALIALGYTLVYGVLLLINFAHGDIFMAGAFIGYFVATLLVGLGIGWPWGFVLTLVFSMILTSLLGVGIERVAYRPLRTAPRLSVVVTALGVGLLLEHLALGALGASRRNLPPLLPEAWTVPQNVGGVTFTWLNVLTVTISLLLMIILQIIVRHTKAGMAMRAISYDKFAVPLMGVPLDRIIALTFIMGSSLAAAAGVMYATQYPVIEPYMGLLVGWQAFIAAVVGGIGDIRGAVVGGFILGFVQIFVVALGQFEALSFLSSTYRDLVAYALLLVILVVRPTGIFGVARRQKV
ncbi:MAG: branched-chain amino acid ABC transporter permease [Chloroflexota bacterium]|nr:branched-chain amino acid ABC transporter permease [Chloroflexota bacterium]